MTCLAKGLILLPSRSDVMLTSLSTLQWGAERSKGAQSQAQSLREHREKRSLSGEGLCSLNSELQSLKKRLQRKKEKKKTMSNLHTKVLRGL